MQKEKSLYIDDFLALSEDIHCMIQKNGRLKWVSDSCKQVFGYTVEELTGKQFIDLIAPQDVSATTKALEKIEKHAVISTFENHCVHKNGASIFSHWTAKYNPQQTLIYCIGKHKSLSKQKKNKTINLTKNKQVDTIEIDKLRKKDIDRQLDKNGSELRRVLENIPMGFALNRISSGEKLFVNKEFSHSYGWHEEELSDVKTFFQKVFSKDDSKKEDYLKIIKDLESGDMDRMQWKEVAVFSEKGEKKYIDAKNIPLADHDLMISTVLDVTEKVHNKIKIEKALNEKKNILESISDAFYGLDQNYNFTYINKSGLSLMNRSGEKLLGKNLFDEFPLLKNTLFHEHLEQVKVSGTPARFDFFYSKLKLWFDENIYPSQEGFSIYFKDITERKVVAQALEAAYEKENEILESISDAFLAVDLDYNFTYINKHAEQLLKIKREVALGKNMWELFSYAADSIARQKYEESIERNETKNFDYYNDQLDKWFNIRSFPSKKGLSIYFRDVTEEKTKQEKLETVNKQLEEFAYTVSHDLQEPLRMISSFLLLLQKKYADELDETAQSYIDFAVDGATRMRQIITDLLEFTRVGTQEEQMEEMDLNEKVQEVLNLLNLSPKELTLKINKLPKVSYSPIAFKQLLQNLIGNAIKYAKADTKPVIEMSWTENTKEFQFEIKDNGIGIDQQFHKRVFEVFQRLHSKSAYPGTGLGLAICKKIVEKHGGNIWLESQVGIGSSFFFTIPKNTKKIDK